jgi:hypothetical protein
MKDKSFNSISDSTITPSENTSALNLLIGGSVSGAGN